MVVTRAPDFVQKSVNKVRDEHLWKDWYFMKREVFLKYRKRKWQMLLIYFQIRNLVNYWLLWSAEWWRILIEWIRSLRQGEYQEEFGDSEECERQVNMLKIIRIEKCKGGWEQMEGDYEKGDWDLWKVWEQYRYEDGLNLCFKVTSAQSFKFLFLLYFSINKRRKHNKC